MSTPAERVKAIMDEAVGSDLNSWEKYEFLPSIKRFFTLSDKQEKTLSSIENRIFNTKEK